jgi:hypothetical protein
MQRVTSGEMIDLPDVEATKLLTRAPGMVRRVAVAGSAFSVGSTICWRDGLGRIHGPATVERTFIDHQTGKTWLSLEYNGAKLEILASLVVDMAETVAPETAQSTAPIAPLQPGWSITHRAERGDLQRGIVEVMEYTPKGWIVVLSDGARLPLVRVEAVGQTDERGRLVSAWQVKEHGFDGHKHEQRGDDDRSNRG